MTADPITACPGCGVLSSENYNGNGTCFQCDQRRVGDGSGPKHAHSPAQALAASRIDLLELIRDGIPEREFVPGTGDAIARAKRHHIAAGPKIGKSLSIGVVAAVDIVLAGGVVVILDRETGAEEYARRLEAVMDARKLTDEQRERLRVNYRYHAWPTLKLEWGSDPSYPQAFAGADVVIFDSSRKFLTNVSLTEDNSDDYSIFADALIDPLTAAGIATAILDNTGHEEKERPRGTSSKADLCDVMFSMKAPKEYSLTRPGRLEMTCTHSRLGELTGTWTLDLGAGSYGHWSHVGGSEARSMFREACIKALAKTGPLGRNALIKEVREHGVKGRTVTLGEWLSELVGDETCPIVHNDDGYTLDPHVPVSGHPRTPPPPDPHVPPLREGGGTRGGPSPRTPPDTPTPRCTCEQPDELDLDGRCTRCWGTP